ncbi:hypothetical protein FOCG_17406 [Fusarium oxysporum f. sp. radicis-lycopersici 26381]|nr:hypothetical protein FOCG_17406 [Fusarium oxysporum f. sp. radicis-lycopersici 26381]
MVYAREMQQGLFSTATMRNKFRSVSRQWHRLLEFRDSDEFIDRVGGAWRRKRERELFETEQEYNQLQRFRRMQQVDIAGQLRQMLGPDAAFRGQQEAVIRAIMRGESPIMQITGTGGGKSMQQQQKRKGGNSDDNQIGEDEKAEDNHTVKIIREWLDKNNHSRVIVYANTIDRVEQLGRLLECSVYHSKVSTTLGKRQRLRSWIEQGHLIVATNALGFGVDMPDMQLVIHAGMPSRLRDYVQESGRAGRDRGQSEAVVVVYQPEGEAGGQPPSSSVNEERGRKAAASSSKSNWPLREAVVERFISGKWCRRVVLDQVIDGQYDRAGCRSESEAECDVCVRQRDRAELEDDILWIEREGDMKVQGVREGQQEREETRVEDVMEQFEKAR